MSKYYLILLVNFCLSFSLVAQEVYLTPEKFINHAFKGESPTVNVVWLTADDNKDIEDILSHKYQRLRIRYWQIENNLVWILDEIGKEKPITIAVHVKDQQIAELKVLTYRESRGDEVRHEFFTSQFISAKLSDDNMLDTHIDGITGATMSVRALSKVARLALWLNKKVQP